LLLPDDSTSINALFAVLSNNELEPPERMEDAHSSSRETSAPPNASNKALGIQLGRVVHMGGSLHFVGSASLEDGQSLHGDCRDDGLVREVLGTRQARAARRLGDCLDETGTTAEKEVADGNYAIVDALVKADRYAISNQYEVAGGRRELMLSHTFLVSALPIEAAEKVCSVARSMRDAAHREQGRKMPTSAWMAREMRYKHDDRTELLPLLVYLVGLPTHSGCIIYSEPDQEVLRAFDGQGDVPHFLVRAEMPRFAEQYEKMLKEPTCDIDVALADACEYFERAVSGGAVQSAAPPVSPKLRGAVAPLSP